jgi:hypothetical protein
MVQNETKESGHGFFVWEKNGEASDEGHQWDKTHEPLSTLLDAFSFSGR